MLALVFSPRRCSSTRLAWLSLAAESAAFDCVNGTGQGGIDGGDYFGKMQLNNGPVDSCHNQYSERAACELLLIRHIFVAGKKILEAALFNQLKQRAIFGSAPLHGYDRLNVVLGQKPHKFARHVFIEENLLQWCAEG